LPHVENQVCLDAVEIHQRFYFKLMGKGVIAMMRNLRKIRLTVLSFVLGAFVIMSEKSSEAAILVLETSKGQVEIEMKPDLAPNHVARIIELVERGFYDDIIFHRVIPGFMAQTGDPTGTGMGGSGENLKAEFTDYEYIEGTVGMARAMNPNSADSQFFICFEGCGHLTGQYTVWGQVTDGMDVVRKINEGQPPAEPDQIVSARIKD
jgi:peptidylprolyl isomerase